MPPGVPPTFPADTNFPPTEELLAELGGQVRGSCCAPPAAAAAAGASRPPPRTSATPCTASYTPHDHTHSADGTDAAAAAPRAPPCLQEEGARSQVIPLAARLLFMEQSIPDEAIATDVSQEEWDEWE